MNNLPPPKVRGRGFLDQVLKQQAKCNHVWESHTGLTPSGRAAMNWYCPICRTTRLVDEGTR